MAAFVKYATIYRIICDGKNYVGATSQDMRRRLCQHKHQSAHRGIKNSELYRKLRAGFEYDFVVIETCPLEMMHDREKYWINELNSYHEGYNLSTGGRGPTNRIFTKSEKETCSRISKMMWQNESIRKKLIERRAHIFQDSALQREKGKLGARARIEKFPTKLCYCKITNKLLGEFKTTVQLASLLNITQHQAKHYLRGTTKVGQKLYRFLEKEGD